jgi:hypothetical protein
MAASGRPAGRHRLLTSWCRVVGDAAVLFVGDDWAEDHHDVEVQGHDWAAAGQGPVAEGVAGIAGLHALIGQFADPEDEAGTGQVLVGIETDRGR